MRHLNRSQRRRLYGAAFLAVGLILGGWLLGPVERGIVGNDRGSYTSYTTFGALKYFYLIHEGVSIANQPVAGYYRRLHFDPGRLALPRAIIIACTAALLVAWHIAVHRRRLAGRCDGCGYPIKTASPRCPECGEGVDHEWYQRQISDGSWLAKMSLTVDRWARVHERRAAAIALAAGWLFLMGMTWGARSSISMNGKLREQRWGMVTWLEYDASTSSGGDYSLRWRGLAVAGLITIGASVAMVMAWRKASHVIRRRCQGCGCDLSDLEGETCPVCSTPRR